MGEPKFGPPQGRGDQIDMDHLVSLAIATGEGWPASAPNFLFEFFLTRVL